MGGINTTLIILKLCFVKRLFVGDQAICWHEGSWETHVPKPHIIVFNAHWPRVAFVLYIYIYTNEACQANNIIIATGKTTYTN